MPAGRDWVFKPHPNFGEENEFRCSGRLIQVTGA